VIFGITYLYITAKYITVLKRTYPFSASKRSRQINIKKSEIGFSFFSALEKKINKIASNGGRNRYIPLNAVYRRNVTTYRYGVKGFL
jgi:hypothetical protein